MDENKFSYLIINHPKEEYFDFYEKDYPNNEFKHYKYEKFKAKEKKDECGTEILEKTENQVKNFLSEYIMNIKSDFKASDILNKNKPRKSSSKSKNEMNNTLKDKINISNNYTKLKIVENANQHSYMSYKDENTIRKNKSNLIVENHYKTDRTSKLKEKINDFINKTKSFGNRIMKSYKSDDVEKNERENKKMININRIQNNNSLIKKHISYNQGNNFLNFKNDNILLNKNFNFKQNSSSLKSQHKKKEKILKMLKTQKSDIFNESNHNSILSDLSDGLLNKKTYELKNNYLDNKSIKYTISKISSNNIKSSNVTKSNISNLILQKKSHDTTELINNRKYPTKRSLNQKSISELKKSMNIQKDIHNSNYKRSETIDSYKKIKHFYNSKYHRLNTQFKSLKEQLKKSIILRPEDLKIKIKPKKSNENNLYISHSKKNNNMKNEIYNNRDSNGNENRNKINSFRKNLDLGLMRNSNNYIKSEEFGCKKIDINLESENAISNRPSKILNKNSKENIQIKNEPKNEKYRILIHKANLYDSLDDEELEDQEEINIFYIDPNSLFNIVFDSFLFILNFLSFIEIPLYLAMNLNFCREDYITFIFSFNFLIDIFNIIDLFLGFFRAFYNWDEQIVLKYKIIVENYLSSWFILDLISCIPFYSINKFYEKKCNSKEFSSKYYNEILNNLNYLFISNRVIKIFKIFWNNQAWKAFSNKINDNWLIIIYIFLFLASINYTACIYIFIGRNSYPNWILNSKLDSQSFINIYICAIYIITMAVTTVGYGDITSYSLNERIFQLFILIIGIIGYSWVVSVISNYIKKINEKSIDFQKKLLIIDDIKRNNPNLPDDLYDRILKHLKFKNFYEKKMKNIIFECLPVGLKNDLISEMYKSIITKFIFFKNFQNTDFIVKVILAFKPIMAYKNDILVNEGDIVEDIMFVKKGVLALELAINMDDPKENIDKYLTSSRLTIPTKPSIESTGKNKLFNIKNSSNSIMNEGKNTRFTNLLNAINERDSNKYNYLYSFNEEKVKAKEKEKKEVNIKKNIIYVKIVWIRENEHFGDVLMFLEQRSPLRVRVKSKKCELFFLKKVDAIKISSIHQNLWKRINKKSVFNFEQIKKNIKKIVEVYCSVKKYKFENKEKYNKNISKSKEKEKEKNKKINNLFISFSKNEKEKIYLRKSKSSTNDKIKYEKFYKNLVKGDIINNMNNKMKYLSMKDIKNLSHINNDSYKNKLLLNSSLTPFSSSYFSSSSCSCKIKQNDIPKVKSNNVVISNNGYKNINIIKSKIDSFEEANKSNKENKKKKLMDEEENNIQIVIKNAKIISSNNCEINEMKNNIISNNYSYSSNNNEIINNNGNESTSLYVDINDELNPGEAFEIIKEDNLLYKKIDLGLISTKQDNSEQDKNLENRNSNLQLLLKSFENANNTPKDKNLNIVKENIINENNYKNSFSSISQNCPNNFISNKNFVFNFGKIDKNFSRKLFESSFNFEMKEKHKVWNNNILNINKNTSFQITSSYENFNLISEFKLIKNNLLQNKIKECILNEINNSFNNNKPNYNNTYIKQFNSSNSILLKKKRKSLTNINNNKNHMSKSSKFLSISPKNNAIQKKHIFSYFFN